MSRKLFQVLITDPGTSIPQEVIDRCNGIRSLYPDFEHTLYDDAMCREFLSNNFHSKVLNAYDTLLPYAYKAALVRYALLYQYGGMYSDIGLQHNSRIDIDRDLVVCEDIKEPDDGPEAKYANGFIYARQPELTVFKYAIEKICANVKRRSYDHYLNIVGIRLWSHSVRSYTQGLDMKVYDLHVGDTWWGWKDDTGDIIIRTKPNGRDKGLGQFGVKPQSYLEMFNNRKVYAT